MSLKKFLFAISFISIATVIGIAGYFNFAEQESALAQTAGKVYYIDWISGLDTNDGLTKSTPWKRAPGMRGCSANCLSKQTAGGTPGDQFILKGGVTWPNDALPWDWIYGVGSAGNPIYFGVDLTWYSGGSFTHPILDAGSSSIAPSSAGFGGMVRLYGRNNGYFVLDNIEFKGLAQLDDVSTASVLYLQTLSFEVKNCYFHGWSHGGTATRDNVLIIGSTLISEGADLTSTIHDNVIDGADTTIDMAMAYKGSAGHFFNNYVANMRNAIVGNPLYVWGNTFYNMDISFDPTSHGNVIENTGGQSIIYNNYISTSAGGATIFTTSIDGHIDYVFNNIIIAQQNQTIQIDNNGLSTGVGAGIYVFNNTIQSPVGVTQRPINGPSRSGYPNLPFMEVRNNHLIADNPTVNFGTKVTTQTESNTIGMTNAAATSAGYILSGAYTYYPPQGGATVDTGYDLTLFCSGIPSSTPSLASAACLSDATLGVNYNTVNHTVSSSARVPIIRSAWDIGAYEYITSTPPPPPSALKGDFNSDSKVNDLDFTSFKNAFKSIFNSIFDLNSDSSIDVKDLGVLMSGWLP